LPFETLLAKYDAIFFFETIFNPSFAKKDSNTAFVTYHHHYPYGIYNEKNTHDAAQQYAAEPQYI
jgi:hypothetical protein